MGADLDGNFCPISWCNYIVDCVWGDGDVGLGGRRNAYGAGMGMGMHGGMMPGMGMGVNPGLAANIQTNQMERALGVDLDGDGNFGEVFS